MDNILKLKAGAYDLIAQIENLQLNVDRLKQELRKINDEIIKVSQETKETN